MRVYGGGVTGRLLAPDILSNPRLERRVRRKLQLRHDKIAGKIGEDGYYRVGRHEWKVPLGIRLCMKRPLVYVQTSNRYPWYVTWRNKDGKRKRKLFAT